MSEVKAPAYTQAQRKKRGRSRPGVGGRPLIGTQPRVHISLTVTPKTQAILKRVSAKRKMSRGLLVDELAANI